MKNVCLVAMLLMGSLCLNAQNPKIQSFFSKYDSQADVVVNINGWLIQSMFSGDSDDQIKAQAALLDHIGIYSFEKSTSNVPQGDIGQLIRSLNKEKFEVLMDIRDGKDIVKCLIKEENRKITELCLLVDDQDEFTIITITGLFDLDLLKEMDFGEDIDVHIDQINNEKYIKP